MKRRKITRLVAALLCLTTLLALVPDVGLAKEDDGPPDMAPRGYVEINGEVAAGVPVVAKVEDPVVDWVEYGPCYTDAAGFFDFEACGIGIPEPAYGLDWKVHFFVWDIEAHNGIAGQTGMTWQPGTVNVGPETDPLVVSKAHLVAEIGAPVEGATIACGQTFDVVATVTNTGEEPATNVGGGRLIALLSFFRSCHKTH